MRLLIISPERVDVPLTGGSLRTGFIASGLARRFETLVLVQQSTVEIEQLLSSVPGFESARWLSIHDKSLHRSRTFNEKVRTWFDRWKERREMNVWQGAFRNWHIGPLRSWRAAIHAVCGSFEPDVAIIEHTRHAATLAYIQRVLPSCVRVINSHNVDSVLYRSDTASTARPEQIENFVQRALNHERRLDKWADALWTCSDADARRYEHIGVRCGNLATVPNGIDTSTVAFRSLRQTRVPRLLFIGTLCYEPNEQGLLWFYRQVWPLLKSRTPNLHWRIVGRYPTSAVERMTNDDGIELFADAPSTAPHLDDSTVFICPLFSGSGTRFKLLEAFSAGIPVVSTAIGAEGLNAQHGEHLLLADDAAAFASSITALLEDTPLADRLRSQARQLVEQSFDWDVIVDDAAIRLETYVKVQ
jgi:glycosyltransferase involved in cell wall biosynthesis